MKKIEEYEVKLLTTEENIKVNGGQYCFGCAAGEFIRDVLIAEVTFLGSAVLWLGTH